MLQVVNQAVANDFRPYRKEDDNIKHRKKYKDYVCKSCWQQLPKCSCDLPPMELVEIDEPIQYAIRQLNNKDYYTRYCCSGHYNGKNTASSAYIMFDHELPPTTPEGWKVNQKRYIIERAYKVSDKKDFDSKQAAIMEALNRWADEV